MPSARQFRFNIFIQQTYFRATLCVFSWSWMHFLLPRRTSLGKTVNFHTPKLKPMTNDTQLLLEEKSAFQSLRRQRFSSVHKLGISGISVHWKGSLSSPRGSWIISNVFQSLHYSRVAQPWPFPLFVAFTLCESPWLNLQAFGTGTKNSECHYFDEQWCNALNGAIETVEGENLGERKTLLIPTNSLNTFSEPSPCRTLELVESS